MKNLIAKAKNVFTKANLNRAAHRIEKSSHFVYFAAAAFGAHDLYAYAAGVIVVVLIAASILHLDVEV